MNSGLAIIFRSSAFIGLLLTSSAAFAQQLFIDCPDIGAENSYRALSEYLLVKRIDVANHCLRLNNYEFVYVTDRNFYYCNFKASGTVPCVEDQSGVWYPDLEIVARFTGANGRRFVLFKTSHLSQGVHGTGYQVFFFTPKRANVRGYKISVFEEAGDYNGLYSDAGNMCSNLEPDAHAISETQHEILNEGRKDLTIRFAQKVTSCKTGADSTRTLEFVFTGHNFVRAVSSPNRLE